MTLNLKTAKIDELISEIIYVSNSIDIPSESNYLIELREEVENRFRFQTEKIFRLSNVAHSGIDLVGAANYDDRIQTAHAWVNTIAEAKSF